MLEQLPCVVEKMPDIDALAAEAFEMFKNNKTEDEIRDYITRELVSEGFNRAEVEAKTEEVLGKMGALIPDTLESLGYTFEQYTRMPVEEIRRILRENVRAPRGGAERVSIPFMITRDMEKQLRDLGYRDSDIRLMTPEEAHRIIDSANASSTAGAQLHDDKGRILPVEGIGRLLDEATQMFADGDSENDVRFFLKVELEKAGVPENDAKSHTDDIIKMAKNYLRQQAPPPPGGGGGSRRPPSEPPGGGGRGMPPPGPPDNGGDDGDGDEENEEGPGDWPPSFKKINDIVRKLKINLKTEAGQKFLMEILNRNWPDVSEREKMQLIEAYIERAGARRESARESAAIDFERYTTENRLEFIDVARRSLEAGRSMDEARSNLISYMKAKFRKGVSKEDIYKFVDKIMAEFSPHASREYEQNVAAPSIEMLKSGYGTVKGAVRNVLEVPKSTYLSGASRWKQARGVVSTSLGRMESAERHLTGAENIGKMQNTYNQIRDLKRRNDELKFRSSSNLASWSRVRSEYGHNKDQIAKLQQDLQQMQKESSSYNRTIRTARKMAGKAGSAALDISAAAGGGGIKAAGWAAAGDYGLRGPAQGTYIGARLRMIVNKGRREIYKKARQIYKEKGKSLKSEIGKKEKTFKALESRVKDLEKQIYHELRSKASSHPLVGGLTEEDASESLDILRSVAGSEKEKKNAIYITKLYGTFSRRLENARKEWTTYEGKSLEENAYSTFTEALKDVAKEIATKLALRYGLSDKENNEILKPMLESEAGYFAQYYARMITKTVKLPTAMLRQAAYSAQTFGESTYSIFTNIWNLLVGPWTIGSIMVTVMLYFMLGWVGYNSLLLIWMPVVAGGFYWLMNFTETKTPLDMFAHFLAGAISMYSVILFMWLLGLHEVFVA